MRGIWGADLNVELVKKIGAAVLISKPERVILGHDTRASCDEIVAELTAVLSSGGAHIVNVGVVPTTIVSYLVNALGADIGIMVTASHNPPQYNGIKVFDRNGEKLGGAELEKLDNFIEPCMMWCDYLVNKFAPIFAGKVLPKIAVDFANGSGTEVATTVFKRLGFDVDAYNAKPDGHNINHECGAIYPERVVRTRRVDVGFAFDGDADRCVVLDDNGKAICGDALIAAFAVHLKSETVVSTIMFNSGAEKFLRDRGISVVRTNIGDRHIMQELKKHEKVIGGEPSGHFFFPHIYPVCDGLVTALVTLQLVTETGRKIREITADIPILPSVLENTNMDIAGGEKNQDGARIIVRRSGTEHLTRIYIEAKTKKQCGQILEQILHDRHI